MLLLVKIYIKGWVNNPNNNKSCNSNNNMNTSKHNNNKIHGVSKLSKGQDNQIGI